ncbi:MAG: AI-2E family transporter [Archangium sp.]
MKTRPVLPAGTLIPPRVELPLANKVVRAIVMIAIGAIVLGVAWFLRFLVLPLVLGFLLTYVLGPLADRLENRGMTRSRAVMICFGGLLAIVGVMIVAMLPGLEGWLQEERQSDDQPTNFEIQLDARFAQWQNSLTKSYPKVDWASHFGKLHELLAHQRTALVEGLPQMALDVLGRAGSLVLGLVIAFFVLLDGAVMKKTIVALMPNRHFENSLLMIHRVDKQISSYLIGTALENLLVTILVAIPLVALGMPNALLFAVIFGICNVIPFAGPFIGAAAGLLFSLLDPNAPSLGALAAVYVIVHFIDAGMISPWVMGKSLDMHPLTVIVGLAIGGTIGGILGMLAIIPIIAVAKAIVTTLIEGVRNASTA